VLTMKWSESSGFSLLPYILICGVALARLAASHPYNILPVFSCLLFFAATRPAREFALPLLALVGVDIFLTTHQYGSSLTLGAGVTWIWYLAVMMIGSGLLRNSYSWRRVAGCSLLISISFFLASNYTVWAEWSMYPKTLDGLGSCYIAAIPFFRNSLLSELVSSLVIFGLSYRFMALPVMRIAPVAHLNDTTL
jgi:hypothetical protein